MLHVHPRLLSAQLKSHSPVTIVARPPTPALTRPLHTVGLEVTRDTAWPRAQNPGARRLVPGHGSATGSARRLPHGSVPQFPGRAAGTQEALGSEGTPVFPSEVSSRRSTGGWAGWAAEAPLPSGITGTQGRERLETETWPLGNVPGKAAIPTPGQAQTFRLGLFLFLVFFFVRVPLLY